MEWFRLYDEIIDDPKVVALASSLWRNYVELMCVANRQSVRGTLPNVEHIAIHLRVKPSKAEAIVRDLVQRGLIDEDPATKGLRIHGWETRQRQSDDAAARMASKRSERKSNKPPAAVRNMFRTNSEPHARATETETDTETESPQTPRRGDVAGEASPGQNPGTAKAGSPAWRKVVDSVPSTWGQAGESACCRLLEVFPADVVAYGLEKVQDKFGADFPGGAAGWWRSVCRNNPEGGPKGAGPRRRADPPLVFSIPNPEEIYHPAKLARLREAGRA